jgi:hypothetical protein
MAGNKATLAALAPDQLDVMRRKLEPLRQESVDALEKGAKPARAFLDEYTK